MQKIRITKRRSLITYNLLLNEKKFKTKKQSYILKLIFFIIVFFSLFGPKFGYADTSVISEFLNYKLFLFIGICLLQKYGLLY